MGDGLTVLATAGLLAGVWDWARAGMRGVPRDRDCERRAFGLAVMAGLCRSPIVWPHYLTLVFVPIALLAPQLSVLWLVPLLAYLAPVELTGGHIFEMLPYLAIEAIVVASLCLRDTSPMWRRRSGVAHVR